MRRTMAWLGAAAALVGLAALVYPGPGRAVVRGHVGDVAAVLLLYAILGLAWRAPIRRRAAVAFAIAAAIELGQIAWRSRLDDAALLVGTTFDPIDLVAYAAGVAIGVAVERYSRLR